MTVKHRSDYSFVGGRQPKRFLVKIKGRGLPATLLKAIKLSNKKHKTKKHPTVAVVSVPPVVRNGKVVKDIFAPAEEESTVAVEVVFDVFLSLESLAAKVKLVKLANTCDLPKSDLKKGVAA